MCGCGDVVPSGRRGPFCSSWCQARKAQGLPPQRPPGLAPSPPSGQSSARAGSGRLPRGTLVDRVRATLERAGLGDTWEAAAALDLADSLEWGGLTPGGRAAAHRELRALMGELMRGVDDPGSRVGALRDEVAARRAKRAAGGAS